MITTSRFYAPPYRPHGVNTLGWGIPRGVPSFAAAPRDILPPGTHAAFDLIALDPIFPAPVRDWRTLDFTAAVNNPSLLIQTVTWSCTVAVESMTADADAESRMIGPPTLNGQQTSQLFGDAIEGVVYILAAQAEFADGRVLVKRGSVACVSELDITPSVPGRVPFDYNLFVSLFPEFKSVTPEQAQAYWVMACEILRNDAYSQVTDLEERRDILMLLTAHIAALFGGPGGGGGFGPTMGGVYTSKSVNGVSLGSSGPFPGVNGSNAWYMQTRYGQLAWMKLRAYRTFHYVPGPQRQLISPWHVWPFTIGGASGWPFPPTIVIQEPNTMEPPRVPRPPGFGVWTDQESIVGTGSSYPDRLRVGTVDPGGYNSDGRTLIRRPTR